MFEGRGELFPFGPFGGGETGEGVRNEIEFGGEVSWDRLPAEGGLAPRDFFGHLDQRTAVLQASKIAEGSNVVAEDSERCA